MSTLTHAPATERQIKQLARVAADAAEEAVNNYESFSKEGAERVHGNPEFALRIREATILAIADLSVSDRYAEEEVESSYTYPTEYEGPKPIEEQIRVVAEIFGLDPASALEYAKDLPKLPSGAEGWFAIPNWLKLPEIFGRAYSQAVKKVLDAIKETQNGKFYNYREGQINEERLRQLPHSKQLWKALLHAQGNPDILIVPAQFGLRHKGRSVRRVRKVIATTAGEFGLDAFATGIMLLTHPDRLQNVNDLWIDCPGDEFDVPDSDDRFDHAPFFGFSDGGVRFVTEWVGAVDDNYGSASAFVPPACTSRKS